MRLLCTPLRCARTALPRRATARFLERLRLDILAIARNTRLAGTGARCRYFNGLTWVRFAGANLFGYSPQYPAAAAAGSAGR